MPTTLGDFSARTVVAGRYCLISELHRGGQSVVWRADDLNIPREVALKLIEAAPPYNTAFVKNEVALACKFGVDPRIAVIYDRGKDIEHGMYYIAMELVDGLNLKDYVQSYGVLAEGEAIQVLREIAAALIQYHRFGIVHSDIKPRNIMLVGRLSSAWKMKLIDFGMARVHLPGVEQPLRIGHTPDWAAPEQLNKRPITTAVDVFALGALAWYLLTGVKPFDAAAMRSYFEAKSIQLDPKCLERCSLSYCFPSFCSIMSELSPAFEEFIIKALSAYPGDRYADAAEMLYTLERLPTKSVIFGQNAVIVPAAEQGVPVEQPALTAKKGFGERVRDAFESTGDVPAAEQSVPVEQPAVIGNEAFWKRLEGTPFGLPDERRASLDVCKKLPPNRT